MGKSKGYKEINIWNSSIRPVQSAKASQDRGLLLILLGSMVSYVNKKCVLIWNDFANDGDK